MMKKVRFALVVLTSLTYLLSACSSKETPVDPNPPVPAVIKVNSISFSIAKTQLEIGEITEIKDLVVNPSNATSKVVSFKSLDTSVAEVNGLGVIAVGDGKTSIVGTVETQPEITYKVDVEVLYQHVTSVELSLSRTEIEVSEQTVATVNILPKNAKNKNYTFEINPSGILSVKNSIFTALKQGYTYVNAVSEDGNVKSNKVLVKVNAMTARGITLTCDKTSLLVNETVNLDYSVQPEEVLDKAVLFKTESGNSDIISVNSNGLVTAIGTGEDYAIAYMKNKPEVFNKIKFTVVAIPATSINASASKTSIEAMETSQISWEVLPNDATDKSVNFKTKSGNNNIVKVSKTGLVTGVSVGSDSIICYLTGNPSINHEIKFTVIETEPASIEISKTDVSIKMNDSHQINAKVLPENTTDKALSYKVLDRNDYSDKGDRFESGADATFELDKAMLLNEKLNIDFTFDKSESKQKLSLMLGQGWNQYFGYFNIYNDGTLENSYEGVSVNEITDGMFRVSFDLSKVTKQSDKPLPNEYVDLIYIRGSWSAASGNMKINREIKNDIISVNSTGLVSSSSLGSQKVRVFLTNHPSIYSDVTFNVNSNPNDPIGDDVYKD